MQYVQPIKSDTIIANGLHRKHCLFGRTATNARIIKMSPLTATLVSNKCQLSKWCYFTPDIQEQGGVEDLQGWAFTTLNHTCIARGPFSTRTWSYTELTIDARKLVWPGNEPNHNHTSQSPITSEAKTTWLVFH